MRFLGNHLYGRSSTDLMKSNTHKGFAFTDKVPRCPFAINLCHFRWSMAQVLADGSPLAAE